MVVPYLATKVPVRYRTDAEQVLSSISGIFRVPPQTQIHPCDTEEKNQISTLTLTIFFIIAEKPFKTF